MTSTDRFICITGAAGFIGFSLAKSLLEQGLPVLGLDSLNDYYSVELKNMRLEILKRHENFQFRHLNLAHINQVKEVFSTFDISRVVHLAAQPGIRYSFTNPHAYVESNLVSFVNLLEVVKDLKLQHFIFASSSSVYGANEERPYLENHNTDRPISLYAATKKSNEVLGHYYSQVFNIPITGLRFFTVYGPWGRPDMAPFLFTKKIIEGSEIEVFNHGKHKRDFTYIDDIVSGVSKILDKGPLRSFDIYNIGSQNPVELISFIRILEDKIKKKAVLKFSAKQAGDMDETFADVSKLIRDYGFSPSTSLDIGCERLVAWYRDYYKA